MISRALLSVSDKTGIIDFARALIEKGIEIISTGGTARLLINSGIPVIEVSDYTGFPEMMDGRLKTLHPKIHGGLLGRRGIDDTIMAMHNILPIDLVVVNLYPFSDTVARPGCTLQNAIEQIDIGGSTLLRAAAKNYTSVTVIVDSSDYTPVLSEITTQGKVCSETCFRLAAKAFQHSACYDETIAEYLSRSCASEEAPLFPQTLTLRFDKEQDLRYGENPHQQAAFYRDARDADATKTRQIQGKSLSYNNLVDSDAALACVRSFDTPACVIVKHANPCGVAVASDLLTAYDRAYRVDPTSAFGGVIAFNQPLDHITALEILRRQFVEVIIAPEITTEALSILATKPNVRGLVCGKLDNPCLPGFDFKQIVSGLLVQERDCGKVDTFSVVTRRIPSAMERTDLEFAWKIVKFIKSNAILLARDGMTLGIGAGQMSRVYSTRIAVLKAADAGLITQGAVLASDAFFPFRDGLDQAAAAGVTAVIQPGGSLRDAEVIAAADEHGMAMLFTGMRHFRH